MSEDNQIQCPLRMHALNNPEAPAFCGSGKCWNYAAWDNWVESLGQVLEEQGFLPGDSLLFWARPSAEYIALLWACFRKEITACPVNHGAPASTVEGWAKLTRARRIYTDRPENTLAVLHPLKVTEATTASDKAPSAGMLFLDGRQKAGIIQTSGTTGVPRGAVLSLGNFLTGAALSNANMPLASGDRWLASLPFFHVSGLSILFRCAQAGACVVLPDAKSGLAEALLSSAATHLSLVPTQLQRLLKEPEAKACLATMKAVLLGGAPASTSLLEEACEGGIPLIPSYGMTETSAQCCAVAPGSEKKALFTSGRPLQPGSLRINEGGMVEYRGAALFQGYLMADGSCHLPLTEEGWFSTGDMGSFDEDGYLHLGGRGDAMLLCGGENIHPEEIEKQLCTLPGVAEVLVTGIADDEYGTLPVAFIRWEEGADCEERVVRNCLSATLPPFKHPRFFFPWPASLQEELKPSRKLFAVEAERLLQEKGLFQKRG